MCAAHIYAAVLAGALTGVPTPLNTLSPSHRADLRHPRALGARQFILNRLKVMFALFLPLDPLLWILNFLLELLLVNYMSKMVIMIWCVIQLTPLFSSPHYILMFRRSERQASGRGGQTLLPLTHMQEKWQTLSYHHPHLV